VPLKGSLLALLHYDDPALRPMADLDLLVRPTDEDRVADFARDCGYVPFRRRERHLVLSRGGRQHSDVVRLGEHPDNPMTVEIHQRVAGAQWGLRYRLTEALWESSAPGLLAGAPARVLSAPLLMRHLLVHAGTNMIDRTLRALHLYDLTVLATHLSCADWEELADRAGESTDSRLLFAPLALLERWLGCQPAPASVLSRLRGEAPARLVRFIQEAPLTRMTICGFRWPRRPRIPWEWYHPGKEWLEPFKWRLRHLAPSMHRAQH
jgi:hypothetical protein